MKLLSTPSTIRYLVTLFGFSKNKKFARKTIREHQQDLLTRQGREQFKKLLKLGQMPVAFL